MLSTTIIISVLLTLLIISFFLWAVFLWLGARWAKIPRVTLRRALLVTLVVNVVQLMVSILMLFTTPTTHGQAMTVAAMKLGLAVLIPVCLISRMLKARFLRAVQVWLPTLVPSTLAVLFVFLVLRPFVAEAFKTSTNSMAPTLLGLHWKHSCPECDGDAYCSPDPFPEYSADRGQLVICADNFHTSQIRQFSGKVHGPDRYLASKFLQPRRWDLVTFRYPSDPTVFYVKRLVGLPGEEVCIKNGNVWIDGKPIALPESIRGLKYESMGQWGTTERPAKLGADEYFVLGDFSSRAKDSRLWSPGAPGHPPYAVPASHMHGVVTHIYWPPSRWRILR